MFHHINHDSKYANILKNLTNCVEDKDIDCKSQCINEIDDNMNFLDCYTDFIAQKDLL
ncbi:MAG: hypothetical protein ACI8ZF_000474 [Candidatus Midichloriaceae bacterium]|jgi:hypothetical protein